MFTEFKIYDEQNNRASPYFEKNIRKSFWLEKKSCRKNLPPSPIKCLMVHPLSYLIDREAPFSSTIAILIVKGLKKKVVLRERALEISKDCLNAFCSGFGELINQYLISSRKTKINSLTSLGCLLANWFDSLCMEFRAMVTKLKTLNNLTHFHQDNTFFYKKQQYKNNQAQIGVITMFRDEIEICYSLISSRPGQKS